MPGPAARGPRAPGQGRKYDQRGGERMKLSARNQFKGTVVEIQEGAVNDIVKIDIGAGNVMSATISKAAVKELQLEVGKSAYAVVKATSVMVGIDD